MRYELYEGPVSEFDDLYIDVIYYSTDDVVRHIKRRTIYQIISGSVAVK